MRIHRAADVEEHQNLDRVAPLGSHMHVEIAVVRRLLDRGVEIELIRRAGAGEFAQTAQRDLDVVDAEFDIAVEILGTSRLSQTLLARLLRFFSCPIRTLRIVTMGAERRG
jgi:hypothetical protein